MISYAQNYEDVILARAFSGQSIGFYIDIGVWHPTVDSVTKHFYDHGWSGVNVEPVPERFSAISDQRPRDTNIRAAVSSRPGLIELHQVGGTGLSTVRADFAERHLGAGYEVTRIQAPTISLRDLCQQFASNGPIDFLKIDVEGAENDVIRSGDWRTYRPRIVLVEATEPNSTVESHSDWDPVLREADYVFRYFDGLNRWYSISEEPALGKAFYAPPNPFDRYKLAALVELESRVPELERRLGSALKKADRLDQISKTLLGKILVRVT